MEVNTQMAIAAAKSVDVAFEQAATLIDEKPGKFLKLLYAFGPPKLIGYVSNGRLRLSQLKMQEALFDQCCKAVLESYAKLTKEMASCEDATRKIGFLSMLEQMEGDIRLMATVRRSLANMPAASLQERLLEKNGPENISNEQTDRSWWSVFEDFARRPNEDWRTGLLAKALEANSSESGAISLRALWEIGMLEEEDFNALAIFCDSSLHVDGKPIILLDPDEQNNFVFDLGNGMEGNLAYCVSALVDRGLLQKALTQFDTTEPVRLEHLSGPHCLRHTPPGSEDYRNSAIQIAAYGPTDYALDICRLYSANFNEASDENYENLKSTLEAAAESEDSIGVVIFDVVG